MAAPKLTETTVNLINDYLQTNIATALTNVRTERNDPIVTTEPPREYFIYPRAHGYRPPAIFIICEAFDFRLETGPNFINGLAKINVTALVEDIDRTRVTIKCWRYQAALSQLLDNTQLTSSDNLVRIVTKQVRHSFSPLYTDMKVKNPEDPGVVFRQEVAIELEVEHYENKT